MLILRKRQNVNVTAKLRCPPEMCPMVYARTKMVKPKVSAMPMAAFPLIWKPTVVMALPHAMNTNSAEPISSAPAGRRRPRIVS